VELLALIAAASIAAGTVVANRTRSTAPTPVVASLERPKKLPSNAPDGQVSRDMRPFDAWVDHPGYAITPQGILATFRLAESGDPQRQCDLIDDLIENDGHLRNLFEQREQSVAGKPWVVQAGGPSDDESTASTVLGWALRRLPMVEIMKHLLTVNRYGWAAVEIDWGLVLIDGTGNPAVDGKRWIVPVWMTIVPARRFKINASSTTPGGINELRIFTDATRQAGEPLEPGKWLVLKRSNTWLARAGLMRTCAWYAMAKRMGFRDWLVYAQRFGLPLPTVKYKAEDADDDEIAVAEQIVKKIGSDGGAVIPDSLELEFHEAAQTTSENSKSHGGLIAHCNAEMSKTVNGSTLANDNAGSGGASYALGEVHATVRWDNVLFDAELFQEGMRTQVAEPMMHFNALRGAAPLTKVQVVRDLDPKVRGEIADTMQNKLGITVSKSQMRQELGFREPSGTDDEAAGAPKPEPAAAPAKEAA
jgi:phage gp29-like protein